jgi:hypothetical protein
VRDTPWPSCFHTLCYPYQDLQFLFRQQAHRSAIGSIREVCDEKYGEHGPLSSVVVCYFDGGKGAYACSRRVHPRTLVHVLVLVGPELVLVAGARLSLMREGEWAHKKTVAVIDAAAAISPDDRVDCERP